MKNSNKTTARTSDNQPKVLIIDDDSINIAIIESELRHDYRIYSALSGEAGLEIAQRELPDLILLDIMMPGINGYEVCQRIQSWHETGNMPVVIFLTSVNSASDEAKGLELGAIDYITKPIHLQVLKQRVKNHLRMKWHRDLLEQLTEELAIKNRQLEILTRQDGLTGLANRRCFDETMELEIRRAHRAKKPFSLLMCDIDYFKSYNDHFGHLAGDDCLRAISALILRLFRRAGDLPARYGGEEFVVIMPDTPADQAGILAETLREALVAEHIDHVTEVADVVTVSIGVVTVDCVENKPAEWFTAEADAAMYQSKKKGRNCVTLKQLK